MEAPPVPTFYLHGSADGAIGAELLTDVAAHLPARASRASGGQDTSCIWNTRSCWAKILGWLAD